MRLRFKIKHVLLLTFIVAAAVCMQVSLDQTISAFKRDIEDVESVYHRDGLQDFLDEHSIPAASVYQTSVDRISFDSHPSIIDYCLFRRTVECRYKLSINFLQRQIAHSRIPKENRVDGIHIDIPTCEETQHAVHLIANPFTRTIETQ
ncbi:hypothetical protein N9Y42_11350 [Mariniblastus sp.]|nr:hypothetical protein [Mariniblastus sp.]